MLGGHLEISVLAGDRTDPSHTKLCWPQNEQGKCHATLEAYRQMPRKYEGYCESPPDTAKTFTSMFTQIMTITSNLAASHSLAKRSWHPEEVPFLWTETIE